MLAEQVLRLSKPILHLLLQVRQAPKQIAI